MMFLAEGRARNGALFCLLLAYPSQDPFIECEERDGSAEVDQISILIDTYRS